MKNQICILFSFVLVLLLMIVFVLNKQKTYEHNKMLEISKEEEIERNKDLKKKELANSYVSLSFSGVKLASHIKSVYTAQNEGRIKIKRKTNDSIFCGAVLYYSEDKKPVDVDLNIGYFQDTITGFNIISEDYNSRDAVMSLYKNKYNIELAETSYGGNDPYIWTFKNQILKIEEITYAEEAVYIKDSRMRMPENRYGIYNRLLLNIL